MSGSGHWRHCPNCCLSSSVKTWRCRACCLDAVFFYHRHPGVVCLQAHLSSTHSASCRRRRAVRGRKSQVASRISHRLLAHAAGCALWHHPQAFVNDGVLSAVLRLRRHEFLVSSSQPPAAAIEFRSRGRKRSPRRRRRRRRPEYLSQLQPHIATPAVGTSRATPPHRLNYHGGRTPGRR
jgi:hypothetical protein